MMNNINSFNIFSSQKHVYKNTTSDVFSLCNRYNWLQRILLHIPHVFPYFLDQPL